MQTNTDYTNEYLEIITNLQGDIHSRRKAREAMKNSSAFCYDVMVEASFVPRLYGQETYNAMERISTTMHKILCKVIDRYLHDPAYRTLFSFDPRLVDLILLPRNYEAILPFSRVDLFLNEDDYSFAFCEFNTDGSSGMNEDREIRKSIENSESYKLFGEKHQLSSSELFDTWTKEFLSIYETYTYKVDKPHIAICDYLENAIIEEFKRFSDAFADRGVEASIVDVRDLRFNGEILSSPDGRQIDAIWRRCVTNDVLENWDSSQALIEAVRSEKVALIGSFAGHIAHDKQIFSVLHTEETFSFLEPHEVEFIKESIPFTSFLDSDHIDLDEVKRNKDTWFIKPTDHYGSYEAHAGRSYKQEEWEGLIDRFANQASGIQFLVQKYCLPFKTFILPPDKNIESLSDAEISTEAKPYNNLSGLYLYNGKFSGVYSRMGPHPTISKQMEGITATSIWVDCNHTSEMDTAR